MVYTKIITQLNGQQIIGTEILISSLFKKSIHKDATFCRAEEFLFKTEAANPFFNDLKMKRSVKPSASWHSNGYRCSCSSLSSCIECGFIEQAVADASATQPETFLVEMTMYSSILPSSKSFHNFVTLQKQAF